MTWQAAEGAEPVVSGSRAVTGWTLDDAATGVYRADVGTGFDTRQLYVDGVQAQRARISVAPSDIALNADRVHDQRTRTSTTCSTLPDQKRIELQAMLSFTNRYAPVETSPARP